MIAVIDYGAGNLGSVYKALRYIGAQVVVTSEPGVVARADKVVLPGVGAFSHCMAGLANAGLVEATRDAARSGRPFLGICVGLQMLFDASDEMGDSPGLGLLPGRVVRFDFSGLGDDRRSSALKIPHIGWNALSFRPGAALFDGLSQGDRVYFVHSFYPEPGHAEVESAWTEYGYSFCCAVEYGNVHATQFHPEKSGAVGLQILRNFNALAS